MNQPTGIQMLAAIADTNGGPIRVRSIPRPEPGPGQVLVRIHASGVNPLDTKIHAGTAAHARHPLPAILGLDLAGVVEAVGAGVESFRAGDEVFGMTGGVGGHPGTLAQFAAVDVDLLAIKPANLSMRESAALPLVFITAWEGLVDRAAVRANQTVLIHGGAGGIGHIAVQLANTLGAQVFATGSERRRNQIESLGATFIDYSKSAVTEYVERYTRGSGFDVIFDTVGGATLDASFAAVARFGHVVSALGWGTHALAPLSFRAASYSGIFTLLPLLTGQGKAHHGEILRTACRLVEAGRVKPQLDSRRFTLESVGDAYAAITSLNARGRLVVDIMGIAKLCAGNERVGDRRLYSRVSGTAGVGEDECTQIDNCSGPRGVAWKLVLGAGDAVAGEARTDRADGRPAKRGGEARSDN